MIKFTLLSVLFISTFSIIAQSSLILPGSAKFESSNSPKFVKYPSVTTSQLSQITSPEAGMTVFEINSGCIKYYNGIKWVALLNNDTTNLPTANVASGNYDECKIVTLTTTSPNDRVFYSLDGTTPTTGSNLYSNPIRISNSTTLKAITINDCKQNSSIMTNNYNITPINGQIGGIHYVNWNFGISKFTTYEINFKIYDYPRNSDGSLNGDGLYFQMYNSYINGQQFYFGIQTTTRNPATNVIGRGFIFSRFGTQDLSNIQIPQSGFTEAGGYEGNFISVRRYYDWKPQSYKFKLTKTSSDAIGDWYSIYLKDLVTQQEDFMGAIRFPLVALNQQGISNGSGSWTEIYSKVNSNTPLPNWHISVINPIVNSNINFITGETFYAQIMKNTDIYYDATNKEFHLYMGANICREHNAGIYNR